MSQLVDSLQLEGTAATKIQHRKKANTKNSPPSPHSKKRKRNVETSIVKKKAKRDKPADPREAYIVDGINNNIRAMDKRLLADYFAQCLRRFEPDLSSLELEDRYISYQSIQDTSSWEMDRDPQNIPQFLEHFSTKSGGSNKLSWASKSKGSPHTLAITTSGMRAAELTRALRTFQSKDSAVAKLFAKHLKIEDTMKFLSNTRVGLAVGTPGRILDLVEQGALQLDILERIVIDGSYVDGKKRGIFDIKEIFNPLVMFLNRPGLKERLTA
ncbi:MAG: hypothetical protein M1829_005558, partial [Trizodia sp. TS-e1964]